MDAGTPAQFITFVKHAQNAGIEPALIAVYKIENHADLQKRWLTFAKERASATTNVAASSDENETKTR